MHRLFCQLDYKSLPTGNDGIRVLFLPHEGELQLVRVPLVWMDAEEPYESGFWKLIVRDFIGGYAGTFRSDFFPQQDPTWEHAYDLLYKDDFLFDGVSKDNTCLKRIIDVVAKSVYGDQRVLPNGSKELNRGPPAHFKGNLLIIKRNKNKGPFMSSTSEGEYLDIGPQDMKIVAKLLYKVNVAYAVH